MKSKPLDKLVLYFHRDGDENMRSIYSIWVGRSFVRAFLRERDLVRERVEAFAQHSSGETQGIHLWIVAVERWWNKEEHAVVDHTFLHDPRARVVRPEEIFASERLDHLRQDPDKECFTLVV